MVRYGTVVSAFAGRNYKLNTRFVFLLWCVACFIKGLLLCDGCCCCCCSLQEAPACWGATMWYVACGMHLMDMELAATFVAKEVGVGVVVAAVVFSALP